MMTTISCGAPYGEGGLGWHLAQLVEETRTEGALDRYYASRAQDGDEAGVTVSPRVLPWLLKFSPARFRPDWRAVLSAELFDRLVAARLAGGEALIGFSGQALHSFRAARQLGYSRLELESPTGHVRRVMTQQSRAEASGIERGWLSERLLRRSLREYELADTITVTSAYARASFLECGVPAEKLRSRRLRVDPRLGPRWRDNRDEAFRIVYVGGLTVMKGVHVLLDAFSRYRDLQAELTLVGGWASRGMRRYIEGFQRTDPRVRVVVGDPLPYLHRADVYVHPSFHDGFGLAPTEALACGVPVVVTEDTGMKEHVVEGVNGFVVPTGDAAALAERLEHIRALHVRPVEPRVGSTKIVASEEER
jgi:glycosyltransferase involved in cell wall biosynthesis